jgi:hypothetical protein
MKFGPQTFGGGDLRLQRPISARQRVYRGQEYPGNYVLKYIFYVVRLLSGPDFTDFPRHSLERVASDLDYTLALFYLADSYMGERSISELKTASAISIDPESSAERLMGTVLTPSKVAPAQSIGGYERLMNNFSGKLGGEAALRKIDHEIGHWAGERAGCQSSESKARVDQLLSALQKRRDLCVLINRVVEEKLGVKPEDSGLAYRPGDINWKESPSVLLEKRRRLFMIFETLVCEHGVDIRELTA